MAIDDDLNKFGGLINYDDAAIITWFRLNKILYSYDNLVTALPLLDLKKDSIYRKLKKISSLKLIKRKVITDKEAFDLLNQNYLVGCQFCGLSNILMHDHHYPIRKKNNGTQVIKICPNCHSKFHQLTDHGVFIFNEECIVKGGAYR